MDLGSFQDKSDLTEACDDFDRISLVSSATSELRPIAELADNFPATWRKLARNAAEPNIFYEDWLLGPAMAHFGSKSDLHLFLFWLACPINPICSDCFLWDHPGNSVAGPCPMFKTGCITTVFLGTPLVRDGFENQFWTALFVQLDAAPWSGFLHINGLTVGGALDQALRAVCDRQRRRCDLVHSEARALLRSDLDADSYYAATVRTKKRKELRRQAKRLGELGKLAFAHHKDDHDLDQWTTDFLALERQGWKGQNGSALDCDNGTRNFFRDILSGAAKAGQLERHDARLDGKPLAMLVNFISGSGSFSFKTTFDEQYSRFFPGVLLQIENLKILEKPRIDWMDSCAAEDHPMIDSLWSERRHIGRFSIELKGLSRTAVFRGVRLGEDIMAHLKGREIVDIMGAQQ